MNHHMAQAVHVVKVVFTFIIRLALLFFRWGRRLTDRIAAKAGYPIAYLTVGVIFGAGVGLFIGGMGIAAMGGAIGVSGFLVFSFIGGLIGRVAGLEKERREKI